MSKSFYSFKGTHIYSFTDSLAHVSKNERSIVKSGSQFTTFSITKKSIITKINFN